ILTGDFNVDQHNDSYLLLNSSHILQDAYEKAPIRYAMNGTFNSFDPNIKTDSRIDHIFLTPDFTVKKYGILTDTYRSPANNQEEVNQSGHSLRKVTPKEYTARLPSDHFPVTITISLPE